MRRSRPCCTTTPGRVTSAAAISGTCVRPAAGWATRPPSRRKGRRPTRWKWACPTSPALSIAPRSAPTAPCSKAYGDSRPSLSTGPATWSRYAPSRGRRPLASRRRAGTTFDQRAQSIAGYEASAEVTTFSSKFDAVLAGKAQFTTQEKAGYDLFRGKAQCNACHRDGGPGEDPLFTDFTASNIGVPANPRLPYYVENKPDALGYVANPAGSSYVDGGVGNFLTSGHLLSQPSAVDQRWLKLAPDNQARFQVPTLRNVDRRPDPGF